MCVQARKFFQAEAIALWLFRLKPLHLRWAVVVIAGFMKFQVKGDVIEYGSVRVRWHDAE